MFSHRFQGRKKNGFEWLPAKYSEAYNFFSQACPKMHLVQLLAHGHAFSLDSVWAMATFPTLWSLWYMEQKLDLNIHRILHIETNLNQIYLEGKWAGLLFFCMRESDSEAHPFFLHHLLTTLIDGTDAMNGHAVLVTGEQKPGHISKPREKRNPLAAPVHCQGALAWSEEDMCRNVMFQGHYFTRATSRLKSRRCVDPTSPPHPPLFLGFRAPTRFFRPFSWQSLCSNVAVTLRGNMTVEWTHTCTHTHSGFTRLESDQAASPL